ncbi:Dolichyl-phosphate-mannose--protein mannosyltransferase 4 [Entomophthora muscae]|uniref:Dolichyl-phosphate-mannose--protein mannosyltransferase 4 n=1 Tax=Entomophthora muscae TaxID=34485 RepID=A0ACC2T2D9_9FUNG|nr:Dolichyl-phosphate-mannose--protein mannosyltransferase 4 [Entomophthora muscae]
MVGLFTFATVGLAVVCDLWGLLDYRRGLSISHVLQHFMARVLGLILIPALVYLSFFWIHFKILTNSGTGDAFMSPEFQTTLKGNNLFTQSLPVKYGDNITLFHRQLKVYLHSHTARYPLRYEDGRISTQGQQVTGYPFKDANNYWRIHPIGPLEEEERPVKNGDVIRLEHLGTASFLMTHDVASPSMPTNEEITTIPINDTSKYKMTLFKLELENQPADAAWESHVHLVKILHVETPVAVWSHRKALPDWGFNQNEVNGNKKIEDPGNLWSVDDIMGVNHTTTEKPPTHRNFFFKFIELQRQMLAKNSQISADHPFATRPWQWPFTHRGCSYWTRDATKEQIYLLGNPIGYWVGTGVAILFLVYVAVDQLFMRRGIDTLRPLFRKRVYNSGLFLVMGYLLHYLPFFPMGRQLFLHHYLPALIFKYLLLGAAFQFTFFPTVDPSFSLLDTVPALPKSMPSQPIKTSLLTVVAAVSLMTMQLLSFSYFAPLTYGTSLASPGQVYYRKWLPSWDFHFAKPPSSDQVASVVPESKPLDESSEVKDSLASNSDSD